MEVVLIPTRKTIVDGSVIMNVGKRVRFDRHGYAEITDEKEIELIKSKFFYGKDYWECKTDVDAVIAKIDEQIKGPAEPEEKIVLAYDAFREEFYKNNEGKGIKDCAVAWNEYKKEQGIE